MLLLGATGVTSLCSLQSERDRLWDIHAIALLARVVRPGWLPHIGSLQADWLLHVQLQVEGAE